MRVLSEVSRTPHHSDTTPLTSVQVGLLAVHARALLEAGRTIGVTAGQLGNAFLSGRWTCQAALPSTMPDLRQQCTADASSADPTTRRMALESSYDELERLGGMFPVSLDARVSFSLKVTAQEVEGEAHSRELEVGGAIPYGRVKEQLAR
eukprot:SAG31_NODE_7257_length_1740_cov_4.884826_3_plen_150_part_00